MLNGKGLHLLRVYLGYTCQQMAEEMFVTKQTISNLETGRVTTKSTRLLYDITLRNHLNPNDPMIEFIKHYDEN